MLTATEVESVLSAELSAQHDGFALELEPGDPRVCENERGELVARVALIVYESDRSLRDVKSQELRLVAPERREDAPRTTAFLRQWARALPKIVAALAMEVDVLMPCDLFLPMPLRDASLKSDEDFARAFSDPETIAAMIRENERESISEELLRCGLGDQPEAFLSLRRPAIWFDDHVWIEPDEEPTPVGSTRFGGEPDLPPGVEWPTFEGRPMTFAAQIDLDSLQRFTAAKELPSTGLLSFFYTFDEYPSMPSRVMHLASKEHLARRATPPGGDRRPELNAWPHELSVTMPSIDSPFYEALLPVEKVAAFRRSLQAAERGEGSVTDPLSGLAQLVSHWDGYDPDSEQHRLLGYCQPHQGDVYAAAEVHTTRGGWDGFDDASPEGIAASRASRRWRLLLQAWAFIDGELLYEQDCGALYFLIPEDALTAHDWSRVWCELQCS